MARGARKAVRRPRRQTVPQAKDDEARAAREPWERLREAVAAAIPGATAHLFAGSPWLHVPGIGTARLGAEGLGRGLVRLELGEGQRKALREAARAWWGEGEGRAA